MIFRNITLRTLKGDFIEFEPQQIQTLKFGSRKVTLDYWKEISDSSTTRIILRKKDYHYSHWRYFIDQLTRTFDIKEYD